MSKYEKYLDEPILAIAIIANAYLVKGKKYKVVSIYNHSDGNEYYVLENCGHIFRTEWFNVIKTADVKENEDEY